MPNRLANETSPYLLQHADNPVDWYPWGDEALEKARTEDKPIFLSIGYSACHWCHVMAHESFEDPQVADVLNRHFVSIKVDREERPDLDQVYMDAVQAMTQHGGWPMSVFLTPEGQPFYGGTYFPPAPRHGLPSFTQLLEAIADAWRDRRQEIAKNSQQITAAIQQQNRAAGAGQAAELSPETRQEAFQGLQQSFDRAYGGWGRAPKFPQPMALEFLLRYHHTSGDQQALQMISQTLEAMARGGMYDQLGGGFHRYSVDERWLVPHFEKMLYDNAQLARVYVHAWQVTGQSLFRTIAEETLDYVIREMTDPAGGFYSTQDADTEGEEGKFYVWSPDEIRSVLGDGAERFMAAYGVTKRGNFEGHNILTLVGTSEEREALAGERRRLLEARERRVRPGRDEKVLASWNGMMLAAFAEAARALDRDDYRQVAAANAGFLLSELRTDGYRLHHSWKEGVARINGFLEDYANLIDGLIELYQATFESQWYLAARNLAEEMIAHFRAPVGFYDTSDDHETLILRPRETQDNAVPSGNSMAAFGLLRLAGLAVRPEYAEIAREAIADVQPYLNNYPAAFGQWLTALDYALARTREVAIVGDSDGELRRMLDVATRGYRPHQVVAAGAGSAESSDVPLLAGRPPVDGRATAYVCVEYTCHTPVTDPGDLERALTGEGA
jgi:uncharacterized protein